MPTPPVYSSTACNGFTRTRRSSKSGIPSRRIKISLLLARRKVAQKAAAGLPKFVHVVYVNFAWFKENFAWLLKGDTGLRGNIVDAAESLRMGGRIVVAVEKYGWIRVVTSGYISDKSG